MKLSASLLVLILASQALPAHAQTATSPSGEAQARSLELEDASDTQRLQSDYRNAFNRTYEMPAYAADEVTETTRTLADGNTIKTSESSFHARDARGRTVKTFKTNRSEERTIIIDVDKQVAYLIRPNRKDVLRISGTPGVFRRTGPQLSEVALQKWSKEFRTALGVKEFEGVKATGTLTETFYPAGAKGNEKEIVEIREHWFANNMLMTMYQRTVTPQDGERTVRQQNVKLGSAPSAVFDLPADYVIRDVLPQAQKAAQ